MCTSLLRYHFYFFYITKSVHDRKNHYIITLSLTRLPARHSTSAQVSRCPSAGSELDLSRPRARTQPTPLCFLSSAPQCPNPQRRRRRCSIILAGSASWALNSKLLAPEALAATARPLRCAASIAHISLSRGRTTSATGHRCLAKSKLIDGKCKVMTEIQCPAT